MGKVDIVPKKYFLSQEDYRVFLEEEKEWMYTRIIAAIKHAFKYDYEFAEIIQASIESDMTIMTFNSYPEEWVNSLNLAMNWFQGEERYEICGEILDLINEIKKK